MSQSKANNPSDLLASQRLHLSGTAIQTALVCFRTPDCALHVTVSKLDAPSQA